jgi:hypothetical protein
MRVLEAKREPRTHPQLECRAQGQGARQWLALLDLLETDAAGKVIAHWTPVSDVLVRLREVQA